jgi:hypothetical protein
MHFGDEPHLNLPYLEKGETGPTARFVILPAQSQSVETQSRPEEGDTLAWVF